MMVSTSVSADFHATFHKLKAEIQHVLQEPNPSAAQVAPLISSLRGTLNQSINSLPAYDQRQYDLQLKELEKQLAALRSKDKPRSKFAFSTKKATPSGSSTSGGGDSGISKDTGPTAVTGNPALAGPSTITAFQTTPVTAPTPAHGASPSHTISNRSLTRLTPSHLDTTPISGSETSTEYTLSLSHLSECLIDLRPSPVLPIDTGNPSSTSSARTPGVLKSLHARGLTRCVLITGILGGSVMLHDLHDCLVIVGAHQFRMHTSSNCNVYLHVTSVPVIEHCSNIGFASYPTDLLDTTPPSTPNRVADLADFDWVRSGPSPNWHHIHRSAQLSTDRIDLIQSQKGVSLVLQSLIPSTAVE